MAGRPPVCKFFREGRCKYGSNCRYYHPTGNTSSSDRGWGYSSNSRSGNYGQSNSRSNDFNRGFGPNYGGGNRYQLFTDNGNESRGGGDGRYQSRDTGQRSSVFDRLGTRSNTTIQDRWNNNGGQDRRQDNWGRGSQHQWGRQSDNWGNKGQDRWGRQSDNWGNKGQDRFGRQSDNWGNKGQDQFGRQSDNWGNKDQNQWGRQSDNWGGGDYDRNSRENYWQGNDVPITPKDIATNIRFDMEEWRTGNMWPLSCYGYTKGAPCLPGLVDASMDELRWEAYQANVSGNLAKYLQNLNELWEKQMSVQRQFSNITEDDVRTMQSNTSALFGSTDSVDTSGLFGSSSPTSSNISLFRKPSLFSDIDTTKSSVFSPSSTGPTVSSMFGGHSQQTDTANSQQSPLPNTSTQQRDSTVDSSSMKLTKLINSCQTRELTKEELEAFSLAKFELGKIPEHAPPVG